MYGILYAFRGTRADLLCIQGSKGVIHRSSKAYLPVPYFKPPCSVHLFVSTPGCLCCLVCSAMATRGVFQLRKLTVKYCDHSGSSKGAREFIRHRIVEFANNTPAAEVATELRPGQHPYIMGDYVTGEVKTIGIKNIAPGEIMDYAVMLRNSSGRKV